MEMMKAEAIRRMKLLKLHQNAIKEFEAEDKLNLSRGGFLYWLNDVQKKMIADFEKKPAASPTTASKAIHRSGDSYLCCTYPVIRKNGRTMSWT